MRIFLVIKTADTSEISVDSTFVMVHQHALSALKRALRRIGGKTTEIYLTTDKFGKPIRINL